MPWRIWNRREIEHEVVSIEYVNYFVIHCSCCCCHCHCYSICSLSSNVRVLTKRIVAKIQIVFQLYERKIFHTPAFNNRPLGKSHQ